MARRFVRSWFTQELNEVCDDSPGGHQIIAAEDTSHMVGGSHHAAYNKPWESEALAVPIEQMGTFNELSKQHGTGARYVPTTNGYAKLVCESRSSRAREMQLRGVFDKDAGYKDYAGSF